MTNPSEESRDISDSNQQQNGAEDFEQAPKKQNNSQRDKSSNIKRGNNRSKESNGRGGRDSRGFKLTPDGLLRHFLGCRNCCYLLTGLQVLYGRDVINRMVSEFDGRWFSIPITRETLSLIQKTYGLRMDLNDHYIDYACEVCCRRMTLELPSEEEIVEESVSVTADSDSRERIEIEPVAQPERRTIEEQVAEWDAGEVELLKLEFKHRR